MKGHRPIRRLVAEQIGEGDGVDLSTIAHALEQELGLELSPEQLAHVSSYGELLQLLRDVLATGAEDITEEHLAACFVRARVVAGGSDGRVSLVRVGWLTPDLAAAIADDVRDSEDGTWLEVLVPDDLTDAELVSLRRWLRGLVSTHVRVDVRRTAERSAESMGPSATPACDDLTQTGLDPVDGEASAQSLASGTGLAPLQGEELLRCTQRRRSEE
jgi:acyl carrier protein